MSIAAWRSVSPGAAGLTLTEIDEPVPGPDEALVAVEAAAINFADLLMLEDRYQVRPPRPFTPGQEIAGTVLRAGASSGLAAGQRVAGRVPWGGFAERALLRSALALALPADFDAAAGAALPVGYGTAGLAFLDSTRLRAGETVLVHAAAGATGLAAVQVARALGARVLATAGDAEKCTLAREHGAEATFVSRGDWLAELRAFTQGAGVDVVFDSVGGDVTEQSLKALARGGRLLIVGFSSGTIPAIAANRLMLRRLSAIGVSWTEEHDAEAVQAVFRRMADWLAFGHIRPVVDIRDGLAALPQALEDLRSRKTVGKIVLRLAASA